MKRLGLGILGFVLLVNASANAAGLRNVRLELKVEPLANSYDQRTTVINVFGNGDVVAKTKLPGRIFAAPVLVERLSSREVQNLNALIQQSYYETLVQPNPYEIRCQALPVHMKTFMAENNTILLQAGAFPCGAVTRRVGSATEQLVNLLNEELSRI